MKINIFLIIISTALAGLAGFSFYVVNRGEALYILFAAGAFLTMFVTLGGLLGLSSQSRGTIINIRVISFLFFMLFLIEHIVFSFLPLVFTPYVVITGVLLLLYILLCFLIMKANV